MEPEEESLDAIIQRAEDIWPDWRDMQIEREMSVRGIYELYERFHRTAMDGEDTEQGVISEVALPKVTTRPPVDVKRLIAENELKRSEDGEIALVGTGE